MIEPALTNGHKAPPHLSTSAEEGHDDRRTWRSVLNLLLAGFHCTRTDAHSPSELAQARLEQWSDEEYIYLEARIPDDESGLELDLNVFNGLIFARFRRKGGEDQA